MGLLGFLKPRNAPKRGPREDLPPEVKRVVDILKEIIDPETGLDIVSEGLLYGLTVKGEKVDVFLLMARSTPECHACQMLAINVQQKILKGVVETLRGAGFERVKVYNELGLLLEES